MTVQELIDELNKVHDKDLPVHIYLSEDGVDDISSLGYAPIVAVWDNGHEIAIGEHGGW